MPPAGAPPPNATFFCEPSSNTCFFYNAALANFTSARAFCQGIAPGGDLARWNQPDKQLAAELFFERLGTLTPMYYWIGMMRRNSSSNFTFVDGSEVPQAASNSPYAHWNWYQPLASSRSGYDCVMSYNAYRCGLRAGAAALDRGRCCSATIHKLPSLCMSSWLAIIIDTAAVQLPAGMTCTPAAAQPISAMPSTSRRAAISPRASTDGRATCAPASTPASARCPPRPSPARRHPSSLLCPPPRRCHRPRPRHPTVSGARARVMHHFRR